MERRTRLQVSRKALLGGRFDDFLADILFFFVTSIDSLETW